MLNSAIVHAHNDGHMTAYEELQYSNNIGVLSEGRENWEMGMGNPRAYGTVS